MKSYPTMKLLKKRPPKFVIDFGTTYQNEYTDKGYSRADTCYPTNQNLFLFGQCSSVSEYRNAFVKKKFPTKVDTDRKRGNPLKQMGSGFDPVIQQSCYQQDYLPTRISPKSLGLLQRKRVMHSGAQFDKFSRRVGGDVETTTTHSQDYLNPHRHTYHWPPLTIYKQKKLLLGNLKNLAQPTKSIYQSDFHGYPSHLTINTRFAMRSVPDSHMTPRGDIDFDTCYQLAYKDRRRVPISRRIRS
ncbi:Hypothetical predicted protein [Octopus vulgaris]|uniref:Uncharacterized protein n=2 Tax=Octopus TaxID=6643 RepID=A0AA36EYB5_OCTVU|nr:uncharacterized protein LOC115223955 isoform X1 [Octopus sinensis]XP_036367508.1 uncharacterized protein LOC115223955 isoform X1 [Octopus sinensis]XP_036367512.1 uncharacterized protein LOC115223955 isoform X1 [Octopus sinensis]CAI9718776.1 Hypothetical predicted protein [Octopus vulgaris]